MQIYLDGKFYSREEARISVFDHGFLYGDSVYEVIRTFGGRPVALAQHFERLRASATAIYLQLPWTDVEIGARMRAAYEASGLREAYVRLVVTRGAGPMTLLPDECRAPCMVVYALPLRTPTADELERGIGVVIPPRLRNDQRALAPAAKTGNYLNNALALVEAKRAGADDAVLLNSDRELTEATTSNVFWVKDGEVRTPSLECGILAGITRTLLIWALRQENVEVLEGRYAPDDLYIADEAFLTGTIRGVSPVVRVDGAPVGKGLPGPVTKHAIAVLEKLLADHAQDW